MSAGTTAASQRRALIFAGAGAALIALVFLASVLAGGGGDDGDDETTAPTIPLPGPTTTTVAEPGDLETFELFTTKNPFTPLVGPTAGNGGTPGGGGTPANGGGGGGGTPTTVGGGGGTGTPGGGGTGTTGGGTGSGGGAEPRRGQRVALVDVFTEAGQPRATVRVNDTVYRVGEGDTFASSFRVLSLDPVTRCGRFLFGDDPFRLCEGDETLK